MLFSVSTSYHVTCFREASTGESAVAGSIYLWANTHSQRKFIINIIILAPPADKSECWTKYLTKLPKFSILYITNYLQTYGKEKVVNWGYEFYYSSITASDFSVRFLCQNILKSFSLKCLQHTLVYFVPLKSSLSVADADRLILTFQAWK